MLSRIVDRFEQAVRAPQVQRFIREMPTDAPWAIVGGAIRDWAIGREPRDIDIVSSAPSAEVSRIGARYQGRRNRFGGWKLDLGSLQVDFWSLDDNWAHRRGAVVGVGLDTIENATFLDVDAGLFLPSEGRLVASRLRAALAAGQVDIVLEENPFPELCAVRAMVLSRDLSLRLAPKLRRYVLSMLTRPDGVEQMLCAQVAHYQATLLSRVEMNAAKLSLACTR